MIRYHLYTENKNIQFIFSLVRQGFKGFTVFDATGDWQGKAESSLCIEIIGETWEQATVECIARRIKAENKQEAVLLTFETVQSELI